MAMFRKNSIPAEKRKKLKARMVSLLICLAALSVLTACVQQEQPVIPPETVGTQTDTAVSDNESETGSDDEAVREDDTQTEAEAEETEPEELTPEEILSSSLFVGDSVTNGFRNYCMRHEELKDVQVVSSMSYSVNHAVNGTMALFFNGERCSMEEAVRSSGAQHVFILLGLNDINLHDVEKYVENWDTLIKRIREMNPDVTIYIESCTPAYISPENTKLSNEKINLRNEAMITYCAENNLHFIDIASPLKDERGGLANRFSSDNFIHLSDQGYDVVVEALIGYLEEAY